MTLTREVLDRICQLAAAELGTISIEGRPGRAFSAAPLHEVKDPSPEPLALHSLSALAVYLKANRDGIDQAKAIVEVEGPASVNVYSELRAPAQERHCYASAQAPEGIQHSFGRRMAQEEFCIWLQIGFAASAERAEVLRLAGKITGEDIRQEVDDGVSQQVSVRGGVSIVGMASVPNPVSLAPFRTFAELEQPASLFVFRAYKGKAPGEPAGLSLHEVGDQRWRAEACLKAAAWIHAHAPGWLVLA